MAGEIIFAPGPLSREFLEHANFPKNLGRIDKPSAMATGVGQCGDSVEVSLLVEGNRLATIRYLPHGCVHTLVCASAMSELATGRTLDQALELNPEEVEAALGGLPENHKHCARLAIHALGEAISDYYRRSRTGQRTEDPAKAVKEVKDHAHL